MTRYILLAIALLSIIPLTDWLADRQFKQRHEQHGYSQSDVSGLNKLIERETKPHHKVWTAAESRSALQTLGWEVAGK